MRVCQLSSLYVLWSVGPVFVFVMRQESDRLMVHSVLCLHLFLCVCIQLGDTAAFIPKNNCFPRARPSSLPSLSPFFPSLPLNPKICLRLRPLFCDVFYLSSLRHVFVYACSLLMVVLHGQFSMDCYDTLSDTELSEI